MGSDDDLSQRIGGRAEWGSQEVVLLVDYKDIESR